MAICLQQQSLYLRRRGVVIPVSVQFLVALLLLVTLAVKVWVKVETTLIGYELATEREVAINLDLQRRELELQRSVLLRPDNLRAMVETRLDLIPLAEAQTVKMELR